MSAALDLDRLAQLEAAATPAPWDATPSDALHRDIAHEAMYGPEGRLFDTMNSDVRHIVEEDGFHWDERGRHDLALVAAMRNALPQLIAEIRRLRLALGEKP